MPEDKRRLRYWVVGKNWAEGWFLLALLAGLFFGVSGLVAAVAAYLALRATGSRLPVAISVAFAVGVGLLGFAVSRMVFAGH